MLVSAWSLIAPAIFAAVCISRTKLHAAAFILGAILWHSIFPPSGPLEKRKDLPSKETYLANLRVETAAEAKKPEEGDAAKEDCPTCWDEIHDPVRLICGHRFCKNCILSWLSGTSAADSCPICKRVLLINTPSTQETINQLAHKLRVCAALVHISTEFHANAQVRDRWTVALGLLRRNRLHRNFDSDGDHCETDFLDPWS
jgi:hypothetical protein